jgi:hypothetical protein
MRFDSDEGFVITRITKLELYGLACALVLTSVGCKPKKSENASAKEGAAVTGAKITRPDDRVEEVTAGKVNHASAKEADPTHADQVSMGEVISTSTQFDEFKVENRKKIARIDAEIAYITEQLQGASFAARQSDNELKKLTIALMEESDNLTKALDSHPLYKEALQGLQVKSIAMNRASAHLKEVEADSSSSLASGRTGRPTACSVCAELYQGAGLTTTVAHAQVANAVFAYAKNEYAKTTLAVVKLKYDLPSQDANIKSIASNIQALREQLDQRMMKIPETAGLLRAKKNLLDQKNECETAWKELGKSSQRS